MTFDAVPDELKNMPVDAAHAADKVATLIEALAGHARGQALPTTDPLLQRPSAANTGVTESATSSGFVDPTPGDEPIAGKFGEQRPGHTHAGIDMSVPAGSTILAATSGTVTNAGGAGDYGNMIEVSGPGGISTRYAHFSGMKVNVGDTVTAGQVIGVSGGVAGAAGSGNSQGPHLHFEVRKDGQAVDPTPFLAGSQAVVGTSSGAPQSPEALIESQVAAVTDLLSGRPPAQKAQTQTATGGDFFGQVLAGIGAPDTPENRRLMQAWQQAEGGSADNPFNTTEGAPGATDFNSVGVKRYPDQATGVAATIRTLTNGRYAGIIAALQAGNNAMAVADAIAASPWGSGGLVKKVLSG